MKFLISGTLGDTYISVCKLSLIKEEIVVLHYTECDYWKQEILDIYSLLPNVKVNFVNFIDNNIDKFSPLPKVGDMNYFPEFPIIETKFNFKDYCVLQTNAGKPDDAPLSVNNTTNTKLFSYELIEKIIADNPTKQWILVGTDERYKSIKKDCINLVGQTTIKEAISLVQQCNAIVCSEGLLSFVAMSNKKPTTIFYVEQHLPAMSFRIFGTPWEKYCGLYLVSDEGILKNE